MFSRLFIMGLLLFGIVACEQTPEKNTGDVNDIREVLNRQVLAWNKGDITGYMAGYWQSDSLRFASGGSVNFGWQVTLERYRQRYNSRDLMGRLRFSEIDVRMVDKTTALVFGKWALQRKSDAPWGLFTLLFRKFDEGWKIVHDHTSSASE